VCGADGRTLTGIQSGGGVLNEILGIPAHPLLIHAAVVFLPLLALAAVIYAVVPKLRNRIGWVTFLLAIAGPISALLAKLSGERLRDRLIAANFPPEILDKVNTHMDYGDRTWWFSLALGIVTLALIFTTSGNRHAPKVPTWVNLALSVVVIALAVGTAIYVFLTGDSGAHAVWENAV